MSRRRVIDLPRKTDPAVFGGGRRRGGYTQRAMRQRMCCFAGCGRAAEAAWSACCDGNIQRPMCPEHDCYVNYLVTRASGDPDGPTKLRVYVDDFAKRIGRDIEIPTDMWDYLP